MSTKRLRMTEDDLRDAIGSWLLRQGYPKESTFDATMHMSGEGDLMLKTIDVDITTPEESERP